MSNKLTSQRNECNCDVKEKIYFKRIYANQSIHCAIACTKCGWISGGIKKPANFNRLPVLDDEKLKQIKTSRCNFQRKRFFTAYSKYLKSENWKELREFIFEMYGGACEDCASPATEVHHLVYGHVDKNGDYQEFFSNFESACDFLVLICHSCHEKRHGRKL